MLKKTIVLSLVIGMMTTAVYAQQGAAPKAAEAPVTQEGNVSFDFRDADIQNVFRILSFKSGVNIVAGPEVTGVVTIKLDDVPWQQALDVILETYGYAYEKKGNIISVTTIENLKVRRDNAVLLAEQEALETEIFTLNFGKASEIIESLNTMKSARGSINFDERTNTVIVTDISGRVKMMAKVIEKLDTTTPQVLIEAKIVETVLTDAENLGIDWTTTASISGSSRPISYPFKIGGTQNRFAGDIDVPDSGDVSYGTLSFAGLEAVFEALKSRTDTNILSNPKIVTLDNQEAVIKVAKTIRVIIGTTTDANSVVTTNREKIDVGITLTVTPHVNSAGFITLEVAPEVSEAITEVVDGEEQTVKHTKKTTTNVMVKDGDTLVIGGLIKDKVTDLKKKIPFLGDIPIIGLVFRKSEKAIEKTDLIIFITPHIITPEMPSNS